MKKYLLYGIIFVLLLVCLGFIAIPSLGLGKCESGKSSHMNMKIGFISLPIDIERCDN